MSTPTFAPFFARVNLQNVSGQQIPGAATGALFPANTMQLVVRQLGTYHTAHVTLTAAGITALTNMWNWNLFNVVWSGDHRLLNMTFQGDSTLTNRINVCLQENPNLIACVPF